MVDTVEQQQAGAQDAVPAVSARHALDFRLFGDFEGVIDLDAQVSHGRLQL